MCPELGQVSAQRLINYRSSSRSDHDWGVPDGTTPRPGGGLPTPPQALRSEQLCDGYQRTQPAGNLM